MSRTLPLIALLVSCFAASLLAPSVVLAQDGPAPREAPPVAQAADLRETLARLREAVRQEEAAFEEAEAVRKAELESLEAERDRLAGELLDRALERRTRAAALTALEAEHFQAEQKAAAMSKVVATVRAAASSYAEAAGVALSERPGSDPELERLRALQAQMRQTTATAPGGQEPGAPLAALLELAGWLHGLAHRVTLSQTELWTARGVRESVDLLAAGQVWFAYRTVNDGRTGLALASAGEASGYRWSEDMPEQVAASIRAAIERLRNSEAGEQVWLPTDVTGRLGAANLARAQTPFETLEAGGPVIVPLVLVAALALLLIGERVWVLYVRNGRARSPAQRILAACLRGDYDAAEAAARNPRGAIARTLAACLRRRTRGQHAMEDSIQEQLLYELPRLNRFLGGIAILAAVAPLLGLLGTVTGIIKTFGVIRTFGNADPGLMAGGISEALITTAVGLTIAIPVVLIHSLLHGRVDRILADAEKQAATLLNTLTHGGPEVAGEATAGEVAPGGAR